MSLPQFQITFYHCLLNYIFSLSMKFKFGGVSICSMEYEIDFSQTPYIEIRFSNIDVGVL